jgi:hypothetical protein
MGIRRGRRQAVAVDREIDRLPDALLPERIRPDRAKGGDVAADVESKVLDEEAASTLERDGAVRRQRSLDFPRAALDELARSGGEVRDRIVHRTRQPKRHAAEGRLPTPIVLERAHPDHRALHPALEPVGARAVLPFPQRFGRRSLGDDVEILELAQEKDHRLARPEAHRGRVELLDVRDVEGVNRKLKRGIAPEAVEGVHHVGGPKRPSRVKTCGTPKVKDPGQRVGVLPARREARLQTHGRIGGNERLVEIRRDREAARPGAGMGIQRIDLVGHRDRDRVWSPNRWPLASGGVDDRTRDDADAREHSPGSHGSRLF